jgi:hypothetical protein
MGELANMDSILPPIQLTCLRDGNLHDGNCLDIAQELLPRLIGLWSVTLISQTPDCNFEVHHSTTGNFNLVYLHWKGQFQLKQILPDLLYMIYTPIAGSIALQINQNQIELAAADPAIGLINPGDRVVWQTSAQGQALLICMSQMLIEQTLTTLLERSTKKPVIFEPTIYLTNGLCIREVWDRL